ncbi:hypothetical protein BLA29_004508 [Euroglyphus maynei]|uniref:Uncharacterized protein n=1 Tax=Euroglyphus maynei TaxID=6958 RepID=A0A1Y3BBN8_EURMA|nr:hypothetical protein BLA29_004508 [Euroglyphus maynei]
MPELDYYDLDGNDDDEDDYDLNENINITHTDSDNGDRESVVGGIAGIVEKFIRGPNKEEINAKSSPEDVYVFLSRTIQDEYGRSIKATIPRIFDHQFAIGERVSQRCFNSFAQFADRLRKHYVWPHKTSSTFPSFNRFALRSYGDFDGCLDIVADDGNRRSNEVFFTGQYCLIQVELPLPELKSSITYDDRILDFNRTELLGTFSEYFLMMAPFLYSNPLSFALCLPSTLHINVRPLSDCYSRLNMTVENLGEFDLESIRQMQSFRIGPFIRQMSGYQILAILFAASSVITALLATAYEVYHRYSNETELWNSGNRPKSLIVCFSFLYSIEQMLINRQLNTGCLDALKSIALAWICLANFYLLGYQPHMISSVCKLISANH